MIDLAVDLCVIGAGAAGLTAASIAAQLGARVALVERGEMGGECLNTGCVPSKALLAAAKTAHGIRASARFGIEAGQPRIHYGAVHRRVHQVIATIAPHDSVERLEGMGVKVIHAEARFVAPRVLMAGEQRVRARRVIIATGSAPAMPKIADLDSVEYFTNETIFDNTTLPKHLLVVGGGPIGIELAQAHRRLGARVTVLEDSKAMPHDDRELVTRLMQVLADEGVTIRENAKVHAVRRGDSGIVLSIEEGGRKSELEGSHLLVATGRSAKVAPLDLDRAHVRFTDHGIVVDLHLRTTARGVYAIGDVVAEAPRFTHVAGYHAGVAVRNALTFPFAKTH
jgi:pyruvate/2-oxoglutarate dehydrogenase complex dihydrolipoamide dehydrogenase (E3) component